MAEIERSGNRIASQTRLFSVGETPALAGRLAQAVRARLLAKGFEPSRLQTRSGAQTPTDANGPGRGTITFVIATIDGRPTDGKEQLSVDGDRAAAIGGTGGRFARAVTLDVHPDVPATPVDAAALRSAEQACQSCKGLWERQGRVGRLGCSCRTGDGGKSCRSSADCEGPCEIPYEQSFGFEGVRCGPKGCTGPNPNIVIPAGHCADHHRTSGCRASIEEVGPSGEVEIRRNCVD